MHPDEYRKMFALEDSYWWYKGLRRILSAQFERHNNIPRLLNILDAGCGTGRILELFKGRGNIVGLDVSRDAIRYSKMRNTGAGLFQASAVSLPFNDNVFDCVITMDVLYMLDSDAEAVREFSRVLKKSGLLMVNLPACQRLYSSHDVAVSGKRRYSIGVAMKIFSENGFKIEKITYWNTILFPLEACVRIINKLLPGKYCESDLRGLPKPVNMLFTGIIYFEAMLLNIFSFPFGLSLFVVARKM